MVNLFRYKGDESALLNKYKAHRYVILRFGIVKGGSTICKRSIVWSQTILISCRVLVLLIKSL